MGTAVQPVNSSPDSGNSTGGGDGRGDAGGSADDGDAGGNAAEGDRAGAAGGSSTSGRPDPEGVIVSISASSMPGL